MKSSSATGVERYGRGLIGPPTFAEYFSLGVQDLLLTVGLEMPDRHELAIPAMDNTHRLVLTDSWNAWHTAFPHNNWIDYSSTKEMQRGFYEEGHIPVIGINELQGGSGGKIINGIKVCRPRDVLNNELSNHFLNGLSDTALKGDQVRIIKGQVSSEQPAQELVNPQQNTVIQTIEAHF